MLLKKINKINNILREKNSPDVLDFKQILIDSDLIITQSNIQVIDDKTVNIEYLIIDISTNETLKTRALGKANNLNLAQIKAYEYIQKTIFSYEKTNSSKKILNKNEIINNNIINRNQQKKLFAMASYEKIHSLIEAMGYESIKDIKINDFSKIIDILEKENLRQNNDLITKIPNIVLNFGKYKGKNLKDIITDKKYIEYLYKNSTNPNIKNASAKALEMYKA